MQRLHRGVDQVWYRRRGAGTEMNDVRVLYHAIARRWEIADSDWVGRCPVTSDSDGMWFGRGPDGRLRELSVEANRVTDALDIIEDSFGDVVADFLRTASPSGDVDVSFSQSMVVSSGLSALPDEPGIPVETTPGRLVVTLRQGTAHIEVSPGRWQVTLSSAPPPESWLRISESASGTLLAAGAVRDRGAEVPFALDTPPSRLHVAVADDPRRPVGTLMERRRVWAEELLVDARRARLRDGSADARRAEEVAAAIGDERLAEEARTIARSARRRWRWTFVVAIAAGIIGLGAVVAVPRLLGSDGAPSIDVFYENCTEARAAGPTPIRRGEPGYRPALDRDNDGLACEG
jgi:hypothetical protein